MVISCPHCKAAFRVMLTMIKARSNVTVTSGDSCGNKHGNRKVNGAEKTLSYFRCIPELSIDSYR